MDMQALQRQQILQVLNPMQNNQIMQNSIAQQQQQILDSRVKIF